MAKAKKKSKASAKAKPAAKKKAPAKRAAAKRAAPKQAAPKKAAPAVVHWEVQARDLPRQQQFFADLFGWTIDANNPMGYGMVPGAGKDTIGGGIGAAHDSASRVTFYIQVPDIDETLARAATLGAETMLPRMEAGPVTMALFRDLEGNVIGLVED
ncbi:MAG TPA: VOC family protein [Polyangia bacterium]